VKNQTQIQYEECEKWTSASFEQRIQCGLESGRLRLNVKQVFEGTGHNTQVSGLFLSLHWHEPISGRHWHILRVGWRGEPSTSKPLNGIGIGRGMLTRAARSSSRKGKFSRTTRVRIRARGGARRVGGPQGGEAASVRKSHYWSKDDKFRGKNRVEVRFSLFSAWFKRSWLKCSCVVSLWFYSETSLRLPRWKIFLLGDCGSARKKFFWKKGEKSQQSAC
jgi:hypothetical protein